MSCERQVPYAVMNYRTLVKEDFFFVDHTRYLRELEKYQTPVFLRPKRFGKSLWVSMLEHYYEVEVVIVEVAGNRGYNWHTLQA